MSRHLAIRVLSISLLLALNAASAADFPLALSDGADPAPVLLPPPAATDDPIARKIHDQLRAPRGSDAARLPALLADEAQVLVEVRFRDDAGQDRAEQALARRSAAVRNVLAPDRFEAVLSRAQLYELARDADVVSIVPARLARPLATTSQGVAAGRANLWQANVPAFNGTGITVAVIDAFDNNSNEINTLQASNDWPPDARVTLLNYKTLPSPAPSGCASNTFGCLGVRHGNATTELVYDIAPAATYRTYDTLTVGDWRRAILDAANLTSTGGSAGAVRAQIISASLGAPLDGKGDGTADAGSIAEASGWARSRGVLVVNAAGNERDQHWGGLFDEVVTGNGVHDWSGSGSNIAYNHFGTGPNNNEAYCIPAGTEIVVDLYWNAWTSPGSNRNYDLYLYRRTNATTWDTLPVAQSTLLQNGGSGQTPQERVSFVASGSTTGCAANSAVFGIGVVRVAGTPNTATNLQVFANIPLGRRVAARSLGFPADSPNVLSIGAINVATAGSNPQEPFSSEGPVLAAGGALPTTSASTDPNLKPDIASFDNVSTVSYGVGGTNPPPATSFTGTSAATPHVAGMAALLMQRNGIPTTAATLDTLIVTPIRTLAATGSNDLGTVGRDYQYGYGKLRFQQEASLAFVQQPSNTAVNGTIAPAVTTRVLDTEGLVVPMGLLAALNIAIGTDPNGGAAVLTGGGSGALVNGVASWNALKINLGGSGYKLRTTGGVLTVDSNAFNITTGAPSALAFGQQPVTTQAGVTLPAITVRVEDSGGNLVTSDNSTQVRLVRADCTGSPVSGGAPTTVVNGVATFSNVVLYTVDSSLRLRAMAPSRSSDDSAIFATTANNDLIFKGTFEGCLP